MLYLDFNLHHNLNHNQHAQLVQEDKIHLFHLSVIFKVFLFLC